MTTGRSVRPVFNSDGSVGVVIRSARLNDLVKAPGSDSALPDSVVCDQVKARLPELESQAEAEELNQSQSVGTCIVSGLSFCFCFRLRQSI